MTILIIIRLLEICWEKQRNYFRGDEEWNDSDCVCFRFSVVPNLKASFVSSDGENPPPLLLLP